MAKVQIEFEKTELAYIAAAIEMAFVMNYFAKPVTEDDMSVLAVDPEQLQRVGTMIAGLSALCGSSVEVFFGKQFFDTCSPVVAKILDTLEKTND